MIEAKNKASVPRMKSVPTVSSVASEFMEDTSTSQVPTLPTVLSDAPPRPTAAAPPQAVHPGPLLLAGTETTPPPVAVLRHAVKSEDGGDYSTDSAPPASAAQEILPTTKAPFAWFTDYTSQLKTATIVGLVMSNIMT